MSGVSCSILLIKIAELWFSLSLWISAAATDKPWCPEHSWGVAIRWCLTVCSGKLAPGLTVDDRMTHAWFVSVADMIRKRLGNVCLIASHCDSDPWSCRSCLWIFYRFGRDCNQTGMGGLRLYRLWSGERNWAGTSYAVLLLNHSLSKVLHWILCHFPQFGLG